MGNQQLHRRFSEEQVRTIFDLYLGGEISAKRARGKLGLGKSRFFEILGEYKKNQRGFQLSYGREKPTRKISLKTEKLILRELEEDKKLVEDKDIPVDCYNYSAIRDLLLEKEDVRVSLPTIIDRAKKHGYYLERKKKKKVHDREVLTNCVGELVQHDSSNHLFSPYMNEKLYLITSLDDHSRLMLFADLFKRDTSWNNILALKSVFLRHGCPLRYYTDQDANYRFVRGRDKNSPWMNFQKFTDDVDPQFKQVLIDCGVDLAYALSPQAKGKIERPYRWIQDRLVRIAAKEKLSTIEELRSPLKELINSYNTKWVHSTTKQIPIRRFEEALSDQRYLFKPFKIEDPDQTVDDIFCLRAERIVDAYRKVSLDGTTLKVPNGTPRQKVDIRIAPSTKKGFANVRFWQQLNFLGSQKVPLKDLRMVRF